MAETKITVVCRGASFEVPRPTVLQLDFSRIERLCGMVAENMARYRAADKKVRELSRADGNDAELTAELDEATDCLASAERISNDISRRVLFALDKLGCAELAAKIKSASSSDEQADMAMEVYAGLYTQLVGNRDHAKN